jgi:hypothetical protein
LDSSAWSGIDHSGSWSGLGGLILYWVGRENGYAVGVAIGREQGRADAYRQALGEARSFGHELVGELTPAYIEKLVKQTYDAQLKSAYVQGYTKDTQDAANKDTLLMFYKLFREKIDSAGRLAARPDATDEELRRQTQALVTTAAQGQQAAGIMAKEVLDGAMADLAEDLRAGDISKMKEILRMLRDSLEGRDLAFRRTVEDFQSAAQPR